VSLHRILVILAALFALLPATVVSQPCASCVPLDHPPGGLYLGQQLGLYPGGANTVPASQFALALQARDNTVPRDVNGVPDPDGWLGFLAIGMSNTNQEFAVFERESESLYHRNPRLVRVDCAVGGWSANLIVDRNASYWTLVDQRVAAAGLDPDQVQVVWLKEAENMIANPSFPAHAESLQTHLRGIVRHLKDRFPQLQLCYLSSRIYGGYGAGEPIAYEGGFAVRWLIEDQMGGDPVLNADALAGPVEAPVLLWGPYLWANGTTPRASDGLVWLSSDLESDHTHPSPAGEVKVAGLLRDFFGYDGTAVDWFLANRGNFVCFPLTLTATADATVDDAQPAQNFGADPTLSWSDPGVRSYVRFDFFPWYFVPENFALHAKLSLKTLADVPIGGVEVVVVSDSTWDESTLTAANAPPLDGAMLGTIPQASRGTAVSLDATAAISAALASGATSFGLALRARLNSTPLQQVGSRESVDPPRLVLAIGGPCPLTEVAPGADFDAMRIGLSSNPFVVGAAILLNTSRDVQHTVVDILDVRGTRVRRLFQGTVHGGQRRCAWDARDDAGRAVANGVYWVRATTPTARAARRLVLIK